mmetsp:Transcript_19737/g.47665  ORF Transcript_19737/g.47665 Transcript_19737/m.47665 type:complete len:304 (-) Transcript_19737:1045-1956(-)
MRHCSKRKRTMTGLDLCHQFLMLQHDGSNVSVKITHPPPLTRLDSSSRPQNLDTFLKTWDVVDGSYDDSDDGTKMMDYGHVVVAFHLPASSPRRHLVSNSSNGYLICISVVIDGRSLTVFVSNTRNCNSVDVPTDSVPGLSIGQYNIHLGRLIVFRSNTLVFSTCRKFPSSVAHSNRTKPVAHPPISSSFCFCWLVAEHHRCCDQYQYFERMADPTRKHPRHGYLDRFCRMHGILDDCPFHHYYWVDMHRVGRMNRRSNWWYHSSYLSILDNSSVGRHGPFVSRWHERSSFGTVEVHEHHQCD